MSVKDVAPAPPLCGDLEENTNEKEKEKEQEEVDIHM